MDGGIWARMEQYQNELRKEFKLISNSGESSSYEHTYKACSKSAPSNIQQLFPSSQLLHFSAVF